MTASKAQSRLTRLEFNEELSKWRCLCACGNIKLFSANALQRTKSCGCLRREMTANKNRSASTHGLWTTYPSLIHRYDAMISRCYNPDNDGYHNYGGRGIGVCEEWRTNPTAYVEWMVASGWPQNKHLQVDREDNNGDYSPSNCRLVARKVNSNNKRNNSLITFGGRTYTVQIASEKFAGVVPPVTITDRVKRGWDADKAALDLTPSGRKKISRAFGLHIMIDGYGSPKDKTTDLGLVFDFLDKMPGRVGMTKIDQPKVFRYEGKIPEDRGITGSVILAESHSSIHLFEEKGYFSFDLFSCKVFNPYSVLAVVKEYFNCTKYDVWCVVRGLDFPR